MSFSSIPIKFVFLAVAGFVSYKLIKRWKKIKNNQKCIIVIRNVDDWYVHEHDIISMFKKSSVIGIDCEWVTVDEKRKPISLVQLASDSGFCVLIRLSKIPLWFLPSGLSALLKDESIIKVGVGVNDDANKLFHDYFLEVDGFVDLRFLAQDLKELSGKNMGLKSLALELLGTDIDKSSKLRCSDWDVEKLSEEQIKYASDDAIISALIFSEIQRRKCGWYPGSSTKFWNDVRNHTNIPFKQKNINSQFKKQSYSQRSNKIRYSTARKKPMYDNCQLVAPDGEILCNCDKRKAEWYVYKGLGEVVREEPFTVKLTFEPSGRPTLDNIFYTKEKTNCCVVCGQTEHYHRKFIVPVEYKKFFPDLMKKNLSHDVLLLCVHCHKKSNILDLEMRHRLADLCNAPLGCRKNIKYQINPELAKMKSAAKALVLSGNKIPESRQNELKQVVSDYYKTPFVTDEILLCASNVDITSPNDSFISHGLKVYQYFCENGGLIQFEKMWRQHFLDSMQPKYLPTMWSVEHNHKRLALQVFNSERDVDFDVSILGLTPELLKEIEEFKE